MLHTDYNVANLFCFVSHKKKVLHCCNTFSCYFW